MSDDQGQGGGTYPGPGATQYPGPSYPGAPGGGYTGPGGPYPGGGYGYPGASPYDPGPQQGTSGWAIAAFVLGLLGIVILGIVFGIIALVRMRQRPQKGKGLAIAGLVLSGAWVVLLVIIIVVAATTTSNNNNQPVSLPTDNTPTNSQASPTTPITSPSSGLNVFSLNVGDCFDNPKNATSIHSVTAIPCGSAHNAQVFGQFHLSGTLYPGNSTVQHDASSDCNSKVVSNLDRAKVNSQMEIRYIFPLEESWYLGQRTISCIVVNPDANLTSSVLVPHPQS